MLTPTYPNSDLIDLGSNLGTGVLKTPQVVSKCN